MFLQRVKKIGKSLHVFEICKENRKIFTYLYSQNNTENVQTRITSYRQRTRNKKSS